MSLIEDRLFAENCKVRKLINENKELKDALKRSIEISNHILRSESVRNFDEFV